MGEKSAVVRASGPEVKLQTDPITGVDAADFGDGGGGAVPAIIVPVLSAP